MNELHPIDRMKQMMSQEKEDRENRVTHVKQSAETRPDLTKITQLLETLDQPKVDYIYRLGLKIFGRRD